MIKTTSMRHGWRKNWEFSKIREWSTHLRLHIWNLWYTGNLPEKENLPVSRAVNLVTILQKRTVMMAMLSTSVLSIPITKKMVRMFYSRIVVFRVPFCLDLVSHLFLKKNKNKRENLLWGLPSPVILYTANPETYPTSNFPNDTPNHWMLKFTGVS